MSFHCIDTHRNYYSKVLKYFYTLKSAFMESKASPDLSRALHTHIQVLKQRLEQRQVSALCASISSCSNLPQAIYGYKHSERGEKRQNCPHDRALVCQRGRAAPQARSASALWGFWRQSEQYKATNVSPALHKNTRGKERECAAGSLH